ncbi:pancreatic triacylglycerol lipase precursor [Anopheles sinensis]|uniref:Pancreatic triacylglycerol lipase n=1 Tax=Anopheles sinensis TaxID=74873 RepID=A0A084W8V7_ANOSI|nr:pancreatic triacylglycerol lipase precursor [Anopheles sinensis]
MVCGMMVTHGAFGSAVYSESQAQISTKNGTPAARDKLALQLDTGKAQPRLRTRHRSSVDVSDSESSKHETFPPSRQKDVV